MAKITPSMLQSMVRNTQATTNKKIFNLETDLALAENRNTNLAERLTTAHRTLARTQRELIALSYDRALLKALLTVHTADQPPELAHSSKASAGLRRLAEERAALRESNRLPFPPEPTLQQARITYRKTFPQ